MATTFGARPEDTVADSRGNVLSGVVLSLYPTQADATAQTSLITTVSTNSKGLWPYSDSSSRSLLWVRDPNGNVWPTGSEEALGAVGDKADQTYVDAGLSGKADAAATTSSLGGKVDKTSLPLNVKDYASLSACITAAPAGSTIYLPTGTYSVASNSGLTKDLTFVGDGARRSVITASGPYGFTAPSSGSARITFRDIGFSGGTSAFFFLNRPFQTSVRFVRCRWSGFSSGSWGIQTWGAPIDVVGCDFDGDGSGLGGGIQQLRGTSGISVQDSRFRYLNRGVYLPDTNGKALDVRVSGCFFDGAWMYLKSTASGSGGTVTYTSTVLTDTAAAFPALTAGSTLRAMAVKVSGTLTTAATNILTDSAANFTTASVRKGDIVRTSTLWGVVDEVVSSTTLKVEDWLDNTTWDGVPAPANATAYTVYGTVVGYVLSNTATTVTVSSFRDWAGNAVTPAAGTRYEVAPKGEYQGVYAYRADRIRLADNTFRRSWADQISVQLCTNAIVEGNVVYDGQDVGITIGQPGVGVTPGVVVQGNRVSHQGTGGIWLGHVVDGVVSGNVIEDANWNIASTYGGITAEETCTRVDISHNTIIRTGSVNANDAILLRGTCTSIALVRNHYSGFPAQDITISGTGVTATSGDFATGTRLNLASSAVGPTGTFQGSGVPAIPASPGSTFRRTDGAAGSSLYVKETASSSTIWRAV
jgi:hypothetical protein